jgi:hypothetical protein
MPRAKSCKSTEPLTNYSQQVLMSVRNFVKDTNPHETASAKAQLVHFTYALLQLCEQEGFTIDDVVREARIRLFNNRKQCDS